MTREILYVDFSNLDYSPEEAEASANAVYDGVETYRQYQEKEREQLEQAKAELTNNHDSLILQMIHSAERAQMPFGQYCDEVVKPAIEAQSGYSET